MRGPCSRGSSRPEPDWTKPRWALRGRHSKKEQRHRTGCAGPASEAAHEPALNRRTTPRARRARVDRHHSRNSRPHRVGNNKAAAQAAVGRQHFASSSAHGQGQRDQKRFMRHSFIKRGGIVTDRRRPCQRQIATISILTPPTRVVNHSMVGRVLDRSASQISWALTLRRPGHCPTRRSVRARSAIFVDPGGLETTRRQTAGATTTNGLAPSRPMGCRL